MERSEMWVVAGTGGRRIPEGLERPLRETLLARRADHPDMVVMSGMAEGFDELLARSALELGIPLWAAVPKRGYGRYYWGEHSLSGRDRLAEFDAILGQARRVTYVCQTLYEGGLHSNLVRNHWMVDHADEFVVGHGGKGTADCLRRIRETGLPYVLIGSGRDLRQPALFG